MAKRAGLGKGLDTLIPNNMDTKKETKIKSETILRLSEIEPNRKQPRKNFDEDALEELADSIMASRPEDLFTILD